jgi:hypothetical protein
MPIFPTALPCVRGQQEEAGAAVYAEGGLPAGQLPLSGSARREKTEKRASGAAVQNQASGRESAAKCERAAAAAVCRNSPQCPHISSHSSHPFPFFHQKKITNG